MRSKDLFATLALCLMIASCIKSEAPNAEADIVDCFVPGDILKRDPRIGNENIILLPKLDADVTNLAIEFELTPGATIDPPSGTPRDFSITQSYVVTSEDRNWKKTYNVYSSFNELPTEYSFEHADKIKSTFSEYYKFYEKEKEKKLTIWDSGNSALTAIFWGKPAESYPTAIHPEGIEGNCAKLQTVSTGGLGGAVGMYIAAGNLFIGEFISTYATQRPLEATRFGLPFNQEPVSMTGHYRYKAGETFQDKDKNPVPGRTDIFDIYAVLYETDEDVKYLDGSNSLTSPNIIAIAQIKEEDKVTTDEWTYFDIPFELKPGKEIEEDKLIDSKYSFSVVLSSSKDGAYFEGALGSTLYVDEIKIHTK